MPARPSPRTGDVVKLPRPYEFDTHKAVAELLDRALAPGWIYSHFPAGELRSKATGGKLKAMGMKAGWADFLLLEPARPGRRGMLHCLELKRPGEPLSSDQERFRDWCLSNRLPWSVAYSTDEAIAVLRGWHAVRVAP